MENTASPKSESSSGNLGCLGWAFIWIGVAMLTFSNWGVAWSGLAISIGIVYLFRAFREKGQEGAALPAVVLIITGATILARLQGWTDFEMWKIWPIFFGAIGLGLVLSWGLKSGGWMKLVIGCLLLLAFGYGMGSRSWYRYQRDLRHFVDYWPVLIIVWGGVLIAGRYRKNREIPHDVSDEPETKI